MEYRVVCVVCENDSRQIKDGTNEITYAPIGLISIQLVVIATLHANLEY